MIEQDGFSEEAMKNFQTSRMQGTEENHCAVRPIEIEGTDCEVAKSNAELTQAQAMTDIRLKKIEELLSARYAS